MSLLLREMEEARRTALDIRLIEGRALGETGFRLGLSRERVRQLELEPLQSTAVSPEWF